MEKFQKYAVKYATVKMTFAAFILFVINFSVFRFLTPRFKELSGNIDIPDIVVFFSSIESHALFGMYGSEARNLYNYIQLADFFYPAIYAVFFVLLIALLAGKINISKAGSYLIYIPLITAVLDYGENISFFIMNRLYPEPFGVLSSIAYVFSAGKWVFFATMILTALALLLILPVYKVYQKKKGV